MNIALPAFFLLLLVIPGFIFHSTFEKVENASIERRAFDVTSSKALFYSLTIHLIALWIVLPIFSVTVDLTVALKVLTGSKQLDVKDFSLFEKNFGFVLLYFVIIYFASWVLGKLSNHVVLKYNPYKTSRFAFDTPWYYELKGKISEQENAQIIKLSCLLDTKNESYLYYGFCDTFYLNREGQLDRIILTDAKRRKISQDENEKGNNSERFYEVKGNRLILKYEDIRNINIEYLYIRRIEEDQEDTISINAPD